MLLWLLSAALADTCPAWSDPTAPIEVENAPVSESSGLAASALRPGVLYTHGDKNDASSLYAFSIDGHFIGKNDVRGATNQDWEDLAAAPCPDRGDCLYIGDIGDNDLQRQDLRVYIAREPDSDDGPAKVMRTLKATWPDGPRDAEALLVHPCSGDVYVAVRDFGTTYQIWRFAPEAHKDTRNLQLVTELTLPEGGDQTKLTGGAFDHDGDRAVLRSTDVVWEWVVDPENPEAHWADPPTVLSIPLDDSEAITYSLEGDLISSSEGFPMTLSSLECADLAPAEGECVFVTEPGCGCNNTGSIPFPLGILALFFMLYSRGPLDV